MTATPLAIVIAGSKSDADHCQKITSMLDKLGIAYEVRIASAHKVTRYLLEMLEGYERAARPRVYITVAGRSNALSGVVDASVVAPVLACPPYSDRYAGLDILSSLRMPTGIAPMVILEPDAAALAAARILALADPAIADRIREYQERLRQQAVEDDRAMAAG